ncbi:MAG: TraV family lipoprotein [Acidobacteria bacterium]|nr:TraV family lipoprotein [Acidobacteriota bacterium]
MKTYETRAPRWSAMPAFALLAALALAGCSRGHVGESWQCPLATGGSCGSVAAVDPAVPETAGGTVLDAPLWTPRDIAPEVPEGTVCAGNCGNGTGPFGWLGRLLGGGESEDRDGGLAPEDGTSENVETASAGQASFALPADLAQALHDADAEGPDGEGLHRGDSRNDGLRTDEVVARIWIAPFVDGNGVYREVSHVRVVLEPSSWRTE